MAYIEGAPIVGDKTRCHLKLYVVGPTMVGAWLQRVIVILEREPE